MALTSTNSTCSGDDRIGPLDLSLWYWRFQLSGADAQYVVFHAPSSRLWQGQAKTVPDSVVVQISAKPCLHSAESIQVLDLNKVWQGWSPLVVHSLIHNVPEVESLPLPRFEDSYVMPALWFSSFPETLGAWHRETQVFMSYYWPMTEQKIETRVQVKGQKRQPAKLKRVKLAFPCSNQKNSPYRLNVSCANHREEKPRNT